MEETKVNTYDSTIGNILSCGKIFKNQHVSYMDGFLANPRVSIIKKKWTLTNYHLDGNNSSKEITHKKNHMWIKCDSHIIIQISKKAILIFRRLKITETILSHKKSDLIIVNWESNNTTYLDIDNGNPPFFIRFYFYVFLLFIFLSNCIP